MKRINRLKRQLENYKRNRDSDKKNWPVYMFEEIETNLYQNMDTKQVYTLEEKNNLHGIIINIHSSDDMIGSGAIE